jgi:hypothetical protein
MRNVFVEKWRSLVMLVLVTFTGPDLVERSVAEGNLILQLPSILLIYASGVASCTPSTVLGITSG